MVHLLGLADDDDDDDDDDDAGLPILAPPEEDEDEVGVVGVEDCGWPCCPTE